MAITSIKTGSSFTNLVKYNDFLGPNPAYIPPSYESIASASPSGTGTVTFSSIPSTYKHLQIRWIARNSTSNVRGNLNVKFNSSSSNYVIHWLQGDGATASANADTVPGSIQLLYACNGASALASTFAVGIMDIIDYASTSKNKTVRSFHGTDGNSASGDYRIALESGLWIDTTAISQIDITPTAGGTFSSGSTFALYGIKG
jgi:hypothetical protein